MYEAEEKREDEAEREGKENGEEDRRWRTARRKSETQEEELFIQPW